MNFATKAGAKVNLFFNSPKEKLKKIKKIYLTSEIVAITNVNSA